VINKLGTIHYLNVFYLRHNYLFTVACMYIIKEHAHQGFSFTEHCLHCIGPVRYIMFKRGRWVQIAIEAFVVHGEVLLFESVGFIKRDFCNRIF
jgi:hypothetical protein